MSGTDTTQRNIVANKNLPTNTMKLQTRQEIVDGVKGEIEYILLTDNLGIKIRIFTEPEAKELYRLLKERFEGKKKSKHHCVDCDNERPQN